MLVVFHSKGLGLFLTIQNDPQTIGHSWLPVSPYYLPPPRAPVNLSVASWVSQLGVDFGFVWLRMFDCLFKDRT